MKLYQFLLLLITFALLLVGIAQEERQRIRDEQAQRASAAAPTCGLPAGHPSTPLGKPMLLPVEHYQQGRLTQKQLPLTPARTALLLIDVWDPALLSGELGRQCAAVTRSRIVPLLQWARSHGVLVIYAAHGRPIDPAAAPAAGDLQVDGSARTLSLALRQRGIDTLLYAGYAAELCVLLRPVGMATMASMGFAVVLVADATAAYGGAPALQVAIDQVRHAWCVTTVAELPQDDSGKKSAGDVAGSSAGTSGGGESSGASQGEEASRGY